MKSHIYRTENTIILGQSLKLKITFAVNKSYKKVYSSNYLEI